MLIFVAEQVWEVSCTHGPQRCFTALTRDVLVWTTLLINFADQT